MPPFNVVHLRHNTYIFGALLAFILLSFYVNASTVQASPQPEAYLNWGGIQNTLSTSIQPSQRPTIRNHRLILQLDTQNNKPFRQLASISLPPQVSEKNYGQAIHVAQVSATTFVALAKLTPDSGHSTHADAPTIQYAWQIQPSSDKRWRVSLITYTEHSLLDPGQQLLFEMKQPYAELIRRDYSQSMYFCGLNPEEHIQVEVYDIERNRFRARHFIDDIKSDLPALTARPMRTPFQTPRLAGYYTWVWGSSEVRASTRSNMPVRPRYLGDNSLDSAWIEGSINLGRGEYTTATINDSLAFKAFRIAPGHLGSDYLFKTHAYPTQLLISTAQGSRYIVDIPEIDYDMLVDDGGLIVELPESIYTHCLSVMILEARPGNAPTRYGDPDRRNSTAISEITPLSEVYAPTAEQTARNVVKTVAQEPQITRRDAIQGMISPLETDLVNAVLEHAEATPGEIQQRIIPLLTVLPSAMAMPPLTQLFQAALETDPQYRTIKRALATYHNLTAEYLLAILESVPMNTKKHEDIVRLVGRTGTSQQIAYLLNSIGQGTIPLRNERVRAISHGGPDLVSKLINLIHGTLFSVKPSDVDRSRTVQDALRALYLIGKRHISDETGEIEPIALNAADSEKMVDILRNAHHRRTLLYIMSALKYYDVPIARTYIADEILPSHADPLVRTGAVQALSLNISSAIHNVLIEALKDGSPDVRIAAIQVLASHDDIDDFMAPVIAYAEDESWTQGLYYAYLILARSEHPKAYRYIESTILNKTDSPSTIIAIRALKRFDKSIAVEHIQSLLMAAQTPFAVRRQLIDLLAINKSNKAELLLLKIFQNRTHFEDLETSDNQNILTRHATLALGARRSTTALPLLMHQVQNDAAVEFQLIALRSLAFYIDENVAKYLEDWYPDAPHELRAEINETISMIRNRLAIKSIQEDIDTLIDSTQ